MNRKFMRALSLAMLVFMLLASSGQVAGYAQSAGTKITIWTFCEPHENWYKWVTAEYTKLHPEVTFDIQVFDNTALQDKLAVVIAADGEGSPDFVDVEQGQFPRYMSEEKMCFVPLTERIKSEGIDKQIVMSRENLYTYNGEIYGIEHALCPVTIAYRKDIFTANGLTYPATWEEYKADAAKLQEKGIYMGAIPGSVDPVGMLDQFPFLKASHNDYVDASGNLNLSEQFKQLMCDIRDMISSGCFYVYETEAERWNMVRENKVASYLAADWGAGWLRDNVPEQAGMWEFTYLPKMTEDASRISVWGGTGLCMMKYSKVDQDLMWDFMKFSQVNKDNCIKKYDLISLYPVVYASMDACNKPVEYFCGQNLGALWQELSPETPVQTQAKWRVAFNDAFAANIYDFKEGNITIDEFCDLITEAVENYNAE